MLVRWKIVPLIVLALTLGSPAVEWPHQPAPGSKVVTFTPEVTLSWPPGTRVTNYQRAQMWLDGVEVSEECVRTSMFVSYRPKKPLARGTHQVRVVVGEVDKSWEFEVEGSKLISGCVFTAPTPLKPFQMVEVEVRGETQGKAWAEIVGFPEKYPLKDKKSGVYRGEFKAPAKLAGHDRQVEVFLQKDQNLDRQFCEGRLSMAAQDLTVSWVSPANGTLVEPVVRVEGQTLPEHKVDILIKPFFRDGVEFGRLPREIQRTVVADEQGKFVFVYEFPKGLPRLAVRLLARAKDEAENYSPTAGIVLYLGARGGLPPLRTEMPKP